MPTLSELNGEIRKRNNELDGLSDELVDSLDSYQKEYERLLLNENFDLDDKGNLKSTMKNYNRAQSINPQKKLGFKEIAIGWVKKYPKAVKDQITFNRTLGVQTDMKFTDITILKVYQNADLESMLSMSAGMDAMVKKELVNSIALNDNYKTSVRNISQAYLGRGVKKGQAVNWADSVMRTSMFGLVRTVDQEIYEDLGIDKFVYLGTLDKRTRDFCRHRVGNTFTKKQVERFGIQNGSGIPGFYAPGGYRCRHSMHPADLLED